MDTSETAVKDRMKNLTDQASALTITSDLEKTTSERVDLFYKFVEVRVHIWRLFVQDNCIRGSVDAETCLKL